jgi:hypothetical protein
MSCLNRVCSEFPDAYEGGADLKAWKIEIDSAFKAKERAMVEAGVAAMPACWKRALEGTRIKKRRLMWKKGSVGKIDFFACEAGETDWGSKLIFLDPYCMGAPSIVVHEPMHTLQAHAGFYQAWLKVRELVPDCPVTGYGGTNPREDFAEAGRLLIYPRSDGITESKAERPCVDRKLEMLRDLINSCPE